MGRNTLTILALLTMSSIWAQSPVIGLFEGEEYGETYNAYYKDTQGDLDKFVGTWLWSKDSVSWKIELRLLKEELIVFNLNNKEHRHYTDLLIGEMVYTENGKELINLLGRFADPDVENWGFSITGNDIFGSTSIPICDYCSDSERRVSVYLEDPNFNYIRNKAVLRHVISNGQETIQLNLRQMYVYDEDNPNPDAPALLTMQYGTYTLVKQ
ncbi:DUF6705 family protein [Aureitalea marina]|uniref:DUF6705 domain-containing protein n=1 Tax=Aureitalea marina TaxID=930804 RepID=A0A2S7KRW6_9FLAO|nr:DUF6705 family protein [Aureitalea marina]PQB05371.1 hypothetical protein BST85_11090 [Aureitalea marina]